MKYVQYWQKKQKVMFSYSVKSNDHLPYNIYYYCEKVIFETHAEEQSHNYMHARIISLNWKTRKKKENMQYNKIKSW